MHPQSISVDGLRLLIIDAHADTRELLKILFETEGTQIKAVATASEALELFFCFQPDVVISEIYLPDEPVHSLLLKVRNFEVKLGRRIPAIALSSFTREIDRAYALKAGFQMYLCKPCELDELVCVVASLSRLSRSLVEG